MTPEQYNAHDTKRTRVAPIVAAVAAVAVIAAGVIDVPGRLTAADCYRVPDTAGNCVAIRTSSDGGEELRRYGAGTVIVKPFKGDCEPVECPAEP